MVSLHMVSLHVHSGLGLYVHNHIHGGQKEVRHYISAKHLFF